ncbi:hypothetical protein J4444_00555 [Candidatus Woesearchaeota archaeon]|nr:hypothetical protein [Candidatus Woesearchaeota archaeon]
MISLRDVGKSLVDYVVRLLPEEEHKHVLVEDGRSFRGEEGFISGPRYDHFYRCIDDSCDVGRVVATNSWEIPSYVGPWQRHTETRQP